MGIKIGSKRFLNFLIKVWCHSIALVTKAADAITIMGKLNTMLTNERKTRLQPVLSEIYQSLWPGFLPVSISFTGDYLPEELRKAKSRHFLEATISKRQKTGLVSSMKRPRTSSEPLNYQDRKNNYSRPHTPPTIETESTELTPHISEKELIPEGVSEITCLKK